ncbi:hypothetical protein IYX23_04770 [Methylocystis sp. L43]|jgi:hypothetical protein|uniref:DUF7007 domain-containing protein n=1 Tax=Methylocystis rosea TaxID=173366 RepID=A0ABX6EPC7_9HYPH|nr:MULTISPECIES: hypothetical protein [Methylocystis]MBG0797006.1 hypothetical protein [Methylocystis sp. L43]MBG0804852.1 hypothetical protein [Methylocystis sp. H15]QGM95751.1 hypothetical protein F7D13_16695 [Methylocystis rosea]
MNSPDRSVVSFHRTRDGFLAARLGQRAFLALPSKSGGISVASAHYIDKSPEEWRPSDFYIVERLLADEAAFRRYVAEIADHERQLLTLDRRELKTSAVTPWGTAQISKVYNEGIISHSTASHGGFHLDEARNYLVHPAYRNADGWYEEDCEWSKVAAMFPPLFTDYERKCADQTLRDCEPDAYEAVNNVVLGPGESHAKDARQFRLNHARDWLVTLAIKSRQRSGFVECVATLGGDRRGAERRFLVPEAEYDPGRHGFVIHPARHEAHEGPSSFVGWTR